MFPVVTLGHPALRRATRPVDLDEITSGSIGRVAAALITAMRAYGGIGIAAPQLAMNVRLCVVAPPGDQHRVLVNPEITEEGDAEATGMEGCLSIPGVQVPVYRPTSLVVSALDLEGEPVTWRANALRARIIAHELDHLDGTLICDHLAGDDADEFRRYDRCQLLGLPSGVMS